MQLVLARDVGHVRDMLKAVDGDDGVAVAYPTVQAALDALRAQPSPGRSEGASPEPRGTSDDG